MDVGKRADLVLLRRNPLRRIANASKIAGVMLNGEWLPAERLAALLGEAAETLDRLPVD